MKISIFIFLPFLAFISCENTEDSQIALQAELDNRLYESNGAIAIENEDGTFFIHGLTTNENLILKIATPEVGNYTLGGNSQNYASFEDLSGNVYLTNPNGEGQIIVSNWNQENKTLSGTFSFRAILPGIDTLFVNNGVFYQIPYGVEPEVEEGPTVAGFFLAEINGGPFNPFNVSAEETETSILITASNVSKTIIVSLPLDVQTGNIILPIDGVVVNYTDDNGTEQALSGNVIVISHETAIKKIKGTFSFQTETQTITLGQFNVTYE